MSAWNPHLAKPQLKLALLVGINKYKDPLWPTLRGPENDLRLLRDLLKEPEFGFKEVLDTKKKGDCGTQKAESEIWTLCSEQATRDAILSAFDDHLIARAKEFATSNSVPPAKGAMVVFSYSGHGSFIKDLNGDESDGMDETIVPTDAQGRDKGQIVDDELKERLDELRKYTTNITIISDSCHSGSITRGEPSRGGSNTLKNNTEVAPVINDGMDSADDYVTISASLPNQFARELYYPTPGSKVEKPYGVLTYNLVALIKQNPGSTYREILNLLQNSLNAQGINQNPTAEGAVDRVVFGSGARRRVSPIFPLCTSKKGKVICSEPAKRSDVKAAKGKIYREITLPVGTIVGARVGGPVAVYAPGTRELSGEAGLMGTGTITESDAFRSRVVVALPEEGSGTIPENAEIVLVSPFFATEKRIVAIDFPEGAVRGPAGSVSDLEVLERVAAGLIDNNYVSAVTTTQVFKELESSETRSAKFSARAIKWEVAVVSNTRAEFLRLSGEPLQGDDLNKEVLFLIDRNGTPLYHFSVPVQDPEAAREVVRALELHTRVAGIKALSNQASPISGKLLMKYIPVERDSGSGGDCNLSLRVSDLSADKTSLPKLRIGDRFYFEIVNASAKKLYIYLYSIGADGGISFFFPPVGANEVLPVGGVFRTCESTFGVFEVTADSVTGPENVKLIATTTPIQGEILESPKIAKQNRGGFSPLDDLLGRAALNSRGGNGAGLSLGDWATVDFNYEVVH